MILVQDQYRQGNRKNFETEWKQDTSKQSFSGSKDVWEGNCDWKTNFSKEIWGFSCEELLTSGKDTDEEENLLEREQEYPEEIRATRRTANPLSWKKTYKNVRFEGSDFNHVLDTSESSSMENELQNGIDCEYEEHLRSFCQEPQVKMKERSKGACKPKWRNSDCYGKYERRPKSSPEKSNAYVDIGIGRRPVSLDEYGEIIESRQRTRKKEHRCPGRYFHGDANVDHVYGDLGSRKSRYKFDYEEDGRRHGDYCDHCILDEAKKKNYSKAKSMSKHHFCHAKDAAEEMTAKLCKKSYRDNRSGSNKQLENVSYHGPAEHCCPPSEYHGKGKKKILEIVQEQQEQLSDSTYKVPCSKFSSHTMPIEMDYYSGTRRGQEKKTNSSQSDWLCWSGKNSVDKMIQLHRFHKLRSRRTRLNRLKNGWKKAFVQTVRDGNRNERVGVLVMGPKGPEFYSKNKEALAEAEPPGNKNLEIMPKSFEVMTVDCKNVYLSSSEPRTFTGNELPCPEDETKLDEKLANFSKNVNEIVKTSEEKFYKSLSSKGFLEKGETINDFSKKNEEKLEEEKKATEEIEEEEKPQDLKKAPPTVSPFESFCSKIPKSLRKREKKVNEESKAMADALNQQAKEYKESLIEKKDSYLETLKQIQQEFPPKGISEETAKANLAIWGMKLEHLSDRKDAGERKIEQGNGDDGKSNNLNVFYESKEEEKAVAKRDTSQETYNQISSPTQKSKVPYDSLESKKYVDHCAGDGTVFEQSHLESTSKRLMSTTNQCTNAYGDGMDTHGKGKRDATGKLISEMFRDLVENGCAISQEESENLQSLFRKANACSNNIASETSSEILPKESNESNRNLSTKKENKMTKRKYLKSEVSLNEEEQIKKLDKEAREDEGSEKNYLEDSSTNKTFKLKTRLDEKIFKKFQKKGKSKKKIILEDKMKILREALPSIAAENEATHLKQLKKYIDRFIERVEASTHSEFQKRKHNCHRAKDAASTDSSEVRVDARKILDIVNNPFKTISSDVTINIAKKLTDALVQEKSNKGSKNCAAKAKKVSEAETDDDRFPQCTASSSSDQCDESEPTYLKQLKKMRNQHLNNIVLEVKKLSDLLRFLDRCNRFTF